MENLQLNTEETMLLEPTQTATLLHRRREEETSVGESLKSNEENKTESVFIMNNIKGETNSSVSAFSY